MANRFASQFFVDVPGMREAGVLRKKRKRKYVVWKPNCQHLTSISRVLRGAGPGGELTPKGRRVTGSPKALRQLALLRRAATG